MHARLAPSSAARRVACPGSRALEEKYPEREDSPHAREGELAHRVAAAALLGDTIDELGVTEEMIEGATLYRGTIEPFGIRWQNIESRVDISIIHPDCWGTPDYHINHKDTLYVFDYKFGHGYVEVFENWQLLEYAAGLVSSQYKSVKMSKITFVIVQPRCYSSAKKVNSWTISVSELRSYFEKLLIQENAAMQSNAQCNPNPECSNCRARHACPALQKTTLEYTTMSTPNTSVELTASEVGQELKYLKHAADLLDARITGLEEEAKYKIRQGEAVTNFRLELGNGREYWKASVEDIIETAALFGIDVKKPQEILTPAQVRKQKLPEKILKSLAGYRFGALKLTEVHGNLPRKIFGGNHVE
jgi:hypothetical protein